MTSVIIFGPTGNVASVAAFAAQKHGAKVHLAMRDSSKPIPGLAPEQEQAGGFVRVQADLTQPATVSAAVKSTGAKRAFIYAAHGSPDYMKATVEAMKASGVEFVIYLSSFGIRNRPLTSVPRDEVISYIHAQHELTLDTVFGPQNYMALRAGGFATNFLRYKSAIAAGEVQVYNSDFLIDCITPHDIGGVIGAMLATGSRSQRPFTYLYGPKVLKEIECIKLIAEVLGQDVKISGIDAEQATEHLVASGAPRPMAEWLIKFQGSEPDADELKREEYETGWKNVELYTGKPALGFKEWLAQNKHLFSA